MVSLSLHSALSGVPASVLEGALVLLPRARPFPRLARLRAPAWAALLPVSIIVGTFGLLIAPGLASSTVFAAAITAPLLAVIAVLLVVRARLLVLPLAGARRRTGGLGQRPGRPRRDRRGHRAGLPHRGGGAAAPHPRPVAAGGRGGDVRGRHHAAAGRARAITRPRSWRPRRPTSTARASPVPASAARRSAIPTCSWPRCWAPRWPASAPRAGPPACWWCSRSPMTRCSRPGLLLPATVPIALTLVMVGIVRATAGGGPSRDDLGPADPAAWTRCGSPTVLSDTRAPAVRTARRTCPQFASARRASLTPPPARTQEPR